MKKKKILSNSNGKNIIQKKRKKRKPPFTSRKDKDFGGIPDLDPKKFLGCG